MVTEDEGRWKMKVDGGVAGAKEEQPSPKLKLAAAAAAAPLHNPSNSSSN
jgi:hypothetical protein